MSPARPGMHQPEVVAVKARAEVAGHAMHPVLMVFPLGLLSTSVIFDVIYFVTDDSRYAYASFLTIAAGILGGLVAGAAGFLDWTKIPKGTRAKRLGALHGIGNEVMLAVFAISWLIRYTRDGNHEPNAVAFALSLGAIGLAGVTGWMGSELVERLGVAVHPGAHADAPSSLRTKVIDLRESDLVAATDTAPPPAGSLIGNELPQETRPAPSSALGGHRSRGGPAG